MIPREEENTTIFHGKTPKKQKMLLVSQTLFRMVESNLLSRLETNKDQLIAIDYEYNGAISLLMLGESGLCDSNTRHLWDISDVTYCVSRLADARDERV